MQLPKESGCKSSGAGRSKAIPPGDWSTYPHDCATVPGLSVLPVPALLLPPTLEHGHVLWRDALRLRSKEAELFSTSVASNASVLLFRRFLLTRWILRCNWTFYTENPPFLNRNK